MSSLSGLVEVLVLVESDDYIMPHLEGGGGGGGGANLQKGNKSRRIDSLTDILNQGHPMTRSLP